MSMAVVYGIHAVESRLRKPGAERLRIRSGKLTGRLLKIMQLAKQHHITVEIVAQESLDAELGEGQLHQGVVLYVSQPTKTVALEDLLVPTTTKRLFLVLDGVTDPGNLGACIRSAATLGVDAVLAPKDGSASLNAAAVKRSSGGVDVVPFIQVTNLARTLEQLKKAGIWIVGTELGASQSIGDIDFDEHIALVMGSEGSGIRPNTAKHCDFLVSIPMVDSSLGFNVSVATGICLYEIYRQRH